MIVAPLILLAAGGTGGHLFPAEAAAIALKKRGADVALATDARASSQRSRKRVKVGAHAARIHA